METITNKTCTQGKNLETKQKASWLPFWAILGISSVWTFYWYLDGTPYKAEALGPLFTGLGLAAVVAAVARERVASEKRTLAHEELKTVQAAGCMIAMWTEEIVRREKNKEPLNDYLAHRAAWIRTLESHVPPPPIKL